MKYLTPDLIARSRSGDDATADLAGTEWDQACKRYNEFIETVDPQLTPSVRRFLKRYCLHDARMLTLAAEDSFASIFLQLDGSPQPGPFIELRYRLAGDWKSSCRLERHAVLKDDGEPL